MYEKYRCEVLTQIGSLDSETLKTVADTMYDDPDFCNDCSGIGDDYYFDENGVLVSACDDCPYYNS